MFFYERNTILKNLKSLIIVLVIGSLVFVNGCNKNTSINNVETSTPTESTQEVSTEEFTSENSTKEDATTEESTTIEPSQEETSTEAPTTQAPTTAPSVSEETTKDPNEYYGKLYTRGQLLAMDNTAKGCAIGGSKDSLNRPIVSLNQQKTYGQYGAIFIDENTTDSIYLTFDLGYEYNNNTNKILDILAANNVKATFYAPLSYIKSYPDTIRRIINEGHTLGNHSVTHTLMTAVDLDRLHDELMHTNGYVEKYFNYKITTFRPPTGNFSIRTLCETKSYGMDSVFWSYSYEDWRTDAQPDPATSLQNAINAAHPGAIYLLHAVSNTNVAILDDLIKALQEDYKFVQF